MFGASIRSAFSQAKEAHDPARELRAVGLSTSDLFAEFLTVYIKELHVAGIEEYASEIIRACEAEGGSARFVAEGTMNLGLGGLNAANPAFYVKSLYMAWITFMESQSLIDPVDASRYRSQVTLAFTLLDLRQLLNSIHQLAVAVRTIDRVPINASGALDGRFRETKQLIEATDEILQQFVEEIGDRVRN